MPSLLRRSSSMADIAKKPLWRVMLWLWWWGWFFAGPTITTAATVMTKKESNVTYPGGLYWDDLSAQTEDGKTFLLHTCHGFVADGHLCAVLGPSGAGKSTLLSALGGTISSSSRLSVNGDVFLYNPDKRTKERLQVQGGRVAWLQQSDHFFSMLTVYETLDLAAFLQLPKLSERQRQRRVRSIMQFLGLTSLQNRRIGDSTTHRGLSGGEKRRLSLALELVSSPQLFFGDEPTSGLDSTLSYKVVKMIKKLTQQRNIPCILSLHQPQSSVFKMLDSLILLAPGGRVCYMGQASEAVRYFAKLGFPCPTQTNPAEFLLDLVSIDSEDPRQASEDDLRIARLASAFADSQNVEDGVSSGLLTSTFLPSLSPFRVPDSNTAISQIMDDDTIQRAPQYRHRKQSMPNPLRVVLRFGRLLLRSWRQNYRNHKVNLIRLVASVGNAYLFTRIFQSIKVGLFTSRSVADRIALLSFAVVNMSMLALMKTIDLFAKEKPVVQREQQRHQYSSLEYLLAKGIAEIPLDTVFAALFTTSLKSFCGLRIGWKALTAAFSLMTVAGASLGFAIGSLSPSGEVAMTAAMPVMIILMTVGIINPSGVDQSESTPVMVEALRQISPIAFAIKAVCIAEYRGGQFDHPLSSSSMGGRSPFWKSWWNILGRGKQLLQDLPKMGALALVQNGDQVLDELGLGQDSYQGAMKHLAAISLANLLVTWIGLRLQAGNTSTDVPPSSNG